MHDWPAIAASLAETLATEVAPQPAGRVHGGCINDSYRWESGTGPIFVKVGAAHALGAFEAEAAGLKELARAEAVRVPKVGATGATPNAAWLALEWIEFGSRSSRAEALLGEQLAMQHRLMAAQYGWERDNTIGSTPSPTPGAPIGSSSSANDACAHSSRSRGVTATPDACTSAVHCCSS